VTVSLSPWATVPPCDRVTVSLCNFPFPLHLSAAYGDMEKMRRLLEEEKHSVSEPDSGGYYALQWAALNNKAAIAQYLLEVGYTSAVLSLAQKIHSVFAMFQWVVLNNKTSTAQDLLEVEYTNKWGVHSTVGCIEWISNEPMRVQHWCFSLIAHCSLLYYCSLLILRLSCAVVPCAEQQLSFEEPTLCCSTDRQVKPDSPTVAGHEGSAGPLREVRDFVPTPASLTL